MKKKKILIPYIEAGACHTVTAVAIEEAIEKLYPNKYDIKKVDLIKSVGMHKFDKTYKKQWDFLLAHPIIARASYIVLEGLRPISRRYIDIFMRDFKERATKYIHHYQPDVILGTHFFATEVAVKTKKKYNDTYKVIGVDLEPFMAHVWMGNKDVDYYIVFSEKAKKDLMGYGLTSEQIKIFDFPLREEFFNINKSKEELIKEYNIHKDKKTAVSLSGGEGIGNVNEYVKDIYKNNIPVNILAVTGRNEKAKKELEELTKTVKSETNLIPLGFVKNMNELLHISDFTITKAGPSTTMESLHMKNPVLYTHWATFNERPNIPFVRKNEIGWYAENKKNFLKIIREITDTNILDEYRNNVDKLKLKSGTEEIAKFVVDNIK